jgi:hypothetical protein
MLYKCSQAPSLFGLGRLIFAILHCSDDIRRNLGKKWCFLVVIITCSMSDHDRYPERNDHDTYNDKCYNTFVAEPLPIIV